MHLECYLRFLYHTQVTKPPAPTHRFDMVDPLIDQLLCVLPVGGILWHGLHRSQDLGVENPQTLREQKDRRRSVMKRWIDVAKSFLNLQGNVCVELFNEIKTPFGPKHSDSIYRENIFSGAVSAFIVWDIALTMYSSSSLLQHDYTERLRLCDAFTDSNLPHEDFETLPSQQGQLSGRE